MGTVISRHYTPEDDNGKRDIIHPETQIDAVLDPITQKPLREQLNEITNQLVVINIESNKPGLVTPELLRSIINSAKSAAIELSPTRPVFENGGLWLNIYDPQSDTTDGNGGNSSGGNGEGNDDNGENNDPGGENEMGQLNTLIVTGSSRFLNTIEGDISGTSSNVTGVVGIEHGGTGATNATQARTNLGIGSVGTINTNGNADTILKGDGTWDEIEVTVVMVSKNVTQQEGDDTRAIGDYSHVEGYNTIASGNSSHAEGYNTCATGNASHAEGHDTRAIGYYSHAEGHNTCASASGNASHAEGISTVASGNYSHAEGGNTNAYGEYSHAEGYKTFADNRASHSSGHYNAAMTTGGSPNNTTGTAFVIGNGTSNRLNAFSVQFSGVVKSARTFTASTTADYAEFFEWEDGNINNEDRVGFFVTLNGEYIKFANSNDDYILGIVSGAPFVLGNGDCDVWNGMVLRDDFNRIIYEPAEKLEIDQETGEEILVLDENGDPVYEGTRPKYNPEYDHTQPYINRADRPEWDPVGMMGVLSVRQDGTAVVNGYICPNDNGIATSCDITDKNAYRVISVINENVCKVVMKKKKRKMIS